MATSRPPKITVPSDCWLLAPAVVATTSGRNPAKEAMAVIRIGRMRDSAAAMAASTTPMPSSRCCSATSTIRMPFLAARPINVTKPTWA